MKPLPVTFRRDKFDFVQIADFHPVYVYSKRKGSYLGYEVIIARPRGGRLLNGRLLEAGWQYPSSEQWGTYGFTCQTEAQAMEKAKKMIL